MAELSCNLYVACTSNVRILDIGLCNFDNLRLPKIICSYRYTLILKTSVQILFFNMSLRLRFLLIRTILTMSLGSYHLSSYHLIDRLLNANNKYNYTKHIKVYMGLVNILCFSLQIYQSILLIL